MCDGMDIRTGMWFSCGYDYLRVSGDEIRHLGLKYREGYGQKHRFGDWPIIKDNGIIQSR